MPRSSDAKSRFVIAAAELFRRRGYSAVGLTDIIEPADAPKGSFYHHFPEGKEQLAAQAVELSGDYVAHHFDKAFVEAESFADGVEALMRTVIRWLDQTNWEIGCPIVSISVDQVPRSALLTEKTRGVFARWLERIEAQARRFDMPDPRGTALRMMIAYEGAWVVARIQRSPEALLQLPGMFRKVEEGRKPGSNVSPPARGGEGAERGHVYAASVNLAASEAGGG